MNPDIIRALILAALGIVAICIASAYLGFLRGRTWSWIPAAPERVQPPPAPSRREVALQRRTEREIQVETINVATPADLFRLAPGPIVSAHPFGQGPQRIQQRRTPGWRKPAGAVSVARPGRWGNPFKIGAWTRVQGRRVQIDAPLAVALHERDIIDRGMESDIRAQLRGKTLMCFCKVGDPCHGDTYLRIANE